MEIWKKIEDSKYCLEVSSMGNVRGFNVPIGNKWGLDLRRDKVYKQSITTKGYKAVQFLDLNGVKRKFFVHRLVSKAFIPNPENKPQVNHINTIKTDNRVENLEWCNNSENQIHSYKNGRVAAYKNKFGKSHNQSKPVIAIKDCSIIEFENITRASEYLKTSVQNVSMNLRGVNKSCKGFKFYYL